RQSERPGGVASRSHPQGRQAGRAGATLLGAPTSAIHGRRRADTMPVRIGSWYEAADIDCRVGDYAGATNNRYKRSKHKRCRSWAFYALDFCTPDHRLMTHGLRDVGYVDGDHVKVEAR